jgi:hypothetical protein
MMVPDIGRHIVPGVVGYTVPGIVRFAGDMYRQLELYKG